MSEKPDWERFGRASKAEAKVITELNGWRRNPRTFDVASYYCQILLHRAHTVMLAEQGIIENNEAEKIINGVKEVEKSTSQDTSLVGYMSTETTLIKLIGEVGGKMHIGRSRNDLSHAQRRMFFRDQTERLIGAIIEFEKMLLKKAEDNIDTIMPGYTHIRQAQPITLAHYLLAHIDAADRSIHRLEDIYGRTNLSPLGSAALAGTSWPIDRTRTMKLLGFDDLCENSIDSVATIDYVMELASAVSIHMSNLSRLAEDIQIWSSDEYAMIDLDEKFAGTSSIMPQKKNPLILESIKSYSAESIGNMVSVVASMKGVTYTNTYDRILLEPVAIDTAVGSTNVMAGVVSTMIPSRKVMAKNLRDGFSTTTDLADALVRIHNLSFRQAHDIVVDVILKVIEQGMKVKDITPALVAESSLKVIGKKLSISEAEIESAVDPEENLKRHNSVGGPAPESVRKMIQTRKLLVKQNTERNKRRLGKLAQAYNGLGKAEMYLK